MLRLFFLLLALVLSPLSTFAAPSFFSDDDQSFSKYEGLSEMRLMTIADTDGSQITAQNGIRITLPENFFSIYHMTYTEETMAVYGTAVDNGRVDANVKPIFEDKAKTLFIEVREDFQTGEELNISKVFLKDVFASTEGSVYSILEYTPDQTVLNSKYISIRSSSNENSQIPDTPYNQKVEIIEGNKVKVSWEDSYDMDITQILFLRGKNSDASGTPYEYIPVGSEEYIDEDVNIGDTMQYYIIATDGRNRSLLGSPLEITVEEYVAPIVEEEAVEEKEEAELAEISDENKIVESEEDRASNESDTSEKEIVYSRKELKEQAKEVMQLSSPLDRIKSVRSQLKQFTKFTDKIWFMRYVIEERNK